jgi:hypothetical protein
MESSCFAAHCFVKGAQRAAKVSWQSACILVYITRIISEEITVTKTALQLKAIFSGVAALKAINGGVGWANAVISHLGGELRPLPSLSFCT